MGTLGSVLLISTKGNAMKKKPIGQLLLEKGLITEAQLTRALRTQREIGGRLGSILVQEGYVSSDDLLSLLEQQLGIETTRLDHINPDPEILYLVPRDLATKYKAVPLSLEKGVLTVATVDPRNYIALDDIRFAAGVRRVKAVLASEEAVKRAIQEFYEPEKVELDVLNDGALFDAALAEIEDGTEPEDDSQRILEIKQASEEPPIVNLVSLIFEMARQHGVSTSGYRLFTNVEKGGGQLIFHLHKIGRAHV